MHIVFVTTELATSNNPSGGLASFMANMARIFASKGHKVTMIVSSVKEQELVFDAEVTLNSIYVDKKLWEMFDKMASFLTLLRKDDKDEIRRAGINIYRSRQVLKTIRGINEREKIDFIHYCNLGGLALCADKRIPYCIRVSGFPNMGRGANLPIAKWEYKQNPLLTSEKLPDYVLTKARYVTVPSLWLKGVIKEQFGVDAVVLESPFVLEKSRWDYQCYDDRLKGKQYIIHYGSLKYLKGTHIVAELAETLLKEYQNLHIVLAGRSESLYDEAGNEIKAYELVEKNAGEYADRVIYVGRLVREQLYPIVQNAELCLLPSRIENLSNACIEAMAMGKIVVATNGASYEQLIENRVSGFLCERDNKMSFLQGVNEAMALSPEERRRMCANAASVTKRLSPDKIYEQYMSFYRKVIREW
jgi:glycosyltransferase involved in cell wall biosynthesis